MIGVMYFMKFSLVGFVDRWLIDILIKLYNLLYIIFKNMMIIIDFKIGEDRFRNI